MNDASKIYGVLVGHKNISFVIDDFQCVFINANMDARTAENVIAVQGFILGRTTERKYIYIHAGRNIEIKSQLTLNTWLYFMSYREDVSSFEAISFQGGILNKLFYKSALELDFSGSERIKCKNDTKRYHLSNQKIKGTLSVGSVITEGMSVEKGDSISIKGAKLELNFDEHKDIQSFSELFGYIFSLCQFLAFRKNIKFEEITIQGKSKQYPEMDETIGDCFVRYENIQETEKDIHNCITFNDIGESVDKLLSSIINNKPKKPQFNLGFIPENDKDVNCITSIKIREVCSALESEMELAKINVEQEKEFEDLVKTLKTIVEKHRDGEKPLTDAKVYDYILGNLRHLRGALADRIEKCFLEHQSELREVINKNQIDQIVNYRNIITHGSYMQLNAELADTAVVLMKLVYCCVLKRIGLDKNTISDMMMHHIIS